MQDRAIRSRLRVTEAALSAFDELGYEGATWKVIAERAGVSEGLVCRYFPTKHALALAVYERTAGLLEEWMPAMPGGSMAQRFTATTRAKLDILEPHRRAIGALVAATLQPDDEGNALGAGARDARVRFTAVFAAAVHGATDAPAPDEADRLARMMYAAHLLVLLVWLQDRDPSRAATGAALELAQLGLSAGLPLALLSRTTGSFESLLQLGGDTPAADEVLGLLLRRRLGDRALSSAARAYHRVQLGHALTRGEPLRFIVSLESKIASLDGIAALLDEVRTVHPPGCELVLGDGSLLVADVEPVSPSEMRRYRALLEDSGARVWGLADAFEQSGGTGRMARLLAQYGRGGKELDSRRHAWNRLLRAAFPGSVLLSALPQPDLSPWLGVRVDAISR